MVERADIDRLHKRIDDTQAQMVEQNKMLTTMVIQLTEIATIVKGWPKPESRPCSYFQNHTEDHKEIAVWLAEMNDHVSEAKETKAAIRREGIGIVSKVFIFVVGGLLLLGLGALAERHYSEPKQGVTASQVK